VTPPATAWDSGYRPYLDGLRAVAVYLVVLFHAGSHRFSGGYIGVDVFFVLSGFLVTRLLLRDLTSRGRVGYSRFYSRRFRRLLPAAFVTLVITALVFSAIASPVQVLDAAGGFKAAFLYVTNWYFIAQATSYFGADVASNPVLHFWSLAVEEQFYLLWPLLLGGLYALSRRFANHRRFLQTVIAAGAVTSLTWAWWLKGTNPTRAYYGTDARAYQLLAGALLALTPGAIKWLAGRRRTAVGMGALGLGGLILVAATAPSLDAIQRGTIVTALTVTLIAALEATRGAGAGRILSVGPFVYLGKISYGTYLWHWPVIVVITATVDPGTGPTIALTLLIATALASLSFHILEHPVRTAKTLDRHRKAVIAIGLATSVTAALVLIPAVTKPKTTNTAAADQALATTGFTPVPHLDWNAIKTEPQPFHNCYGKPAESCVVVHGTGPTIMLVGDSHAAMVEPTFVAIAQQHDLTLAVSAAPFCPWQQDLYVVRIGQGSTNCSAIKDDLYARVLPALHPSIVVDMNLGYDEPRQKVVYVGPDGKPVAGGSPGEVAWTERTTTDSLAAELANAGKVILIEPVPNASVDELSCLSQARVVEQCRFVANSQPTTIETLYRKLDRENGQVWSLDMDKLVCPYFPICDPIIDKQVVRFDGSHLTPEFAQTLAPAVNAYLQQNGILGQ
jgi:peptidoglycan/LPS O-acetylase OafA/YrhL